MHLWLIPLVALALAGASPAAAKLDQKAINEAKVSDKPGDGPSAAIIKAQVLLDRARFSPGVIDGLMGENVRQALTAFRKANGLPEGDKLDQQTWSKLTATSSEPILKEYTISKDDVDGPFAEKIPEEMEEMAKLDRLSYRNPRELIAEKFHMDEDLLEALNAGKAFEQAEIKIMVANVGGDKPEAAAEKLVVDKAERSLRVLGKDGKLLAFYPATIGSKETPAPTGTQKIERIARGPTYTYNPEYGFKGVKAKDSFTIKAGPNNPVGSIWLALTGEGYGIHGTPEPSKIGKSFSHGCVRLTNWDAEELAEMVEKGTPVEFKD